MFCEFDGLHNSLSNPSNFSDMSLEILSETCEEPASPKSSSQSASACIVCGPNNTDSWFEIALLKEGGDMCILGGVGIGEIGGVRPALIFLRLSRKSDRSGPALGEFGHGSFAIVAKEVGVDASPTDGCAEMDFSDFFC